MMIFATTAFLLALMGTEPAIPSCQARPLSIDMKRLHTVADVQAVNVNQSASVVTILFRSGDVLRLHSNDDACASGSVVYGRLWSVHLIDQGNAIQKAKYVTEIIFSPKLAEKIDYSMESSKLTAKPSQWYFEGTIEGGGWWASVAIPLGLDGMGRTMSIVYTFPSGEGNTQK